jgi:hypothetical protein
VTEAQAAILPSSTGSATYTFKTSAVSMTLPTPSTGVVGSQTLTFKETASTAAPDGNTTGPLNGATNGVSPITGAGTYVCATTQALPAAQPSLCSQLPTLFGAAACAIDTGANAVAGSLGPTLTIADVGANGTYNIVSCKDDMTWSTSTATVSFAAYSRTIAMTGSAADFNAAETIAGSGGTAYVSWDTTNLYLGLTYAGLATTDYVQVYVGSSNGTGVGTADNSVSGLLSTGAIPTFPAGFNALYHVFWKVDNTVQGINQYAGSWQTTTNNAFEVQFNLGNDFVEFAIPLTSLAVAGNDLHLLGGDWAAPNNEAEWPSAAPASNNNGHNWLGWQTEFLNDAYSPNDTNNLNVP